MGYKSIAVLATGASEDADCLVVGARLAARCGAQMRVIPAFPDPAADLVYYGAVMTRGSTPESVERVREGECEAQRAIEEMASEAARAENLKVEQGGVGPSVIVETRSLMPALALAEAAIVSDLVLFSGAVARNPLSGGLFAETLLSMRAPILVVKNRTMAFQCAAIAWDGSAQAGRAVRAALPLLKQVQQTIVLQHHDDLDAIEAAGAKPDHLLAHLARHGVNRVRVVSVNGGEVGAALLTRARDETCDVLIAGAYGRPRLYELVLGGTTRALVREEGGPHVLLAH